jgi:hypothetical protein
VSLARSKFNVGALALCSAGTLSIAGGLLAAVPSIHLVADGHKIPGIVLASPRGARHPVVRLRINDVSLVRELGGFSVHSPGSFVLVLASPDHGRHMQIDDAWDLWGGSVGTVLVGCALIGVAFIRNRIAG